jgi:hypothetical protein
MLKENVNTKEGMNKSRKITNFDGERQDFKRQVIELWER